MTSVSLTLQQDHKRFPKQQDLMLLTTLQRMIAVVKSLMVSNFFRS